MTDLGWLETVVGAGAALAVTAALGTVILRRVLGTASMVTVVTVTLVARLATAAYRYAVVMSPAGRAAGQTPDAYRYLEYGAAAARDGTPLVDAQLLDGTWFTIRLAQAAFSLLGPSRPTVFLLGALAGLVGVWLLAAAAAPLVEPQHRLALALGIGLFPSTLYWSSAFGKEALTLLAIGCVALAVSVVLQRGWAPPAIALLVTGSAVAFLVRSQVALLLLVALGASVAIGRRSAGPRRRRVGRMLATAASVVVLLAFSGLFFGPIGSGLEATGIEVLEQDLQSRLDRTSIGDAQLGSGRRGGPLGVLTGIGVAVARPLPWEGGVNEAVSSADTLLFLLTLVLIVRAWPHRSSLRSGEAALLGFFGVVALGLMTAVAGYGNLGLLVRMRALLVPAVIVVAFSAWSVARRRARPLPFAGDDAATAVSRGCPPTLLR